MAGMGQLRGVGMYAVALAEPDNLSHVPDSLGVKAGLAGNLLRIEACL